MLYCYLPEVRIEPAASRWINLRGQMPLTVTLCVLLAKLEWFFCILNVLLESFVKFVLLWKWLHTIKIPCTFTYADYADDIVLLEYTPDQAESLLHSLELSASGIGLHVNAHKTEYMCFNQRGNFFTLNASSLKLVDKFTYPGSNVSSTKTDINTRLAKAWIANDRLSII